MMKEYAMKNGLPAVGMCCVALVAAAVSVTARGQDGRNAPPADHAEALAQSGWLAGEWRGSMWGGVFEAYYSTPEGGKVLSHSRLLKEGKQAFYEFELFEIRDGALYLQPFPGGRPAVGLTLKEFDAKARRMVFENPEKDYPTQIVYQCVAADQLVITLTDPHGGSDKVERFGLRRVEHSE